MRFKLVTLGALSYVGLKQHKSLEQHVETRSFWKFFGDNSLKTKSVSIPNENLPKLPSRTIKDTFVVYQYATCPFCNKLTAYLDYYGIPYQKVEVQPIPKTQLKWFKGEKKKVPTLRIYSETEEQSETVSCFLVFFGVSRKFFLKYSIKLLHCRFSRVGNFWYCC